MAQSIGAFLILWGLWVFLFNNKHKGVPLLLAAGLLFICIGSAFAHDPDHHEFDAWYSAQVQPDTGMSCCGPADRYFCNNIHTRNGKNYCNLEDDGVVPGRTPHPAGMEIEIPDSKMKFGPNDKQTPSNPTGHNVIWLSSGTDPAVFCFILGSGI